MGVARRRRVGYRRNEIVRVRVAVVVVVTNSVRSSWSGTRTGGVPSAVSVSPQRIEDQSFVAVARQVERGLDDLLEHLLLEGRHHRSHLIAAQTMAKKRPKPTRPVTKKPSRITIVC